MKTRYGMLAALAAALVIGTWSTPDAFAQVPGGTLSPDEIAKFAQPLVIPPVMPRTGKVTVRGGKNIEYYEIAVRQFSQQILPPGLPPTTVWSYGSAGDPATFHYPAFTIEAKHGRPLRVKWINDLKDAAGNYLPHLLPIDQTLHWANPPGGALGRDGHTMDPEPYQGPVPMVTHVHGSHATEEADGFPEAWYLPAAGNIPEGFATHGSLYERFQAKAEKLLGQPWEPGAAVFQYENDQDAATLWYHDHTLGMTRANVYAGPAGFYLIRGGPRDEVTGTLPGPARRHGDPPGQRYYEIPIAIQDRSFDEDGSLFYADSRAFFDGFAGPYIGDPQLPSDISPIWNPEFFGNTMVVNGRAWPFLDVEQRRYRFRFLNGCNSRFLILATDYVDEEGAPLPFWQIGAEGGFLPAPERRTELLMAPAERADVIVDFTDVPVGTRITLVNIGPDEPFGGGVPGVDFTSADPLSTGMVMEFRVGKRTRADRSTDPALLVLPAPAPMPPATVVRQVSLNEVGSQLVCVDEDDMAVPCGDPGAVEFGPRAALLGTLAIGPDGPVGVPMMWSDGITEDPALGATETWEIFNFTEDAHPIHIHEVQFEVLNRQVIGEEATRPPDAGEGGRKDTVIAYPGEITRVTATFDNPGLFVWHCHIVEHEDNEMMRPLCVGECTPP